jgi:hypothetical protein
MKPDDVAMAYTREKSLTICVVDYGDDEFPKPMVLIEGHTEDLEFLGNLLIAEAKYGQDCEFWFSPTGPGNVFFSPESTHGVYIHRLPCLNPPPPKR